MRGERDDGPADEARRLLADLDERVRPLAGLAGATARLDDLFRSGDVPHPLPDGFLDGRFVTTSVHPLADLALRRLADVWMPWRGKSFDRAGGRGINVWSAGGRVEAFPFATRIAPAAVDPGLDVVQIDYDLDENPSLVRRVLDELVEVADGLYLGKTLLRVGAAPRPVGYFCLDEPAWAG
jgi:hypothetical protein